MDDVLAQFTSITSADPERASQYLHVTDFNLEQAIQLYFESDGVDMGGSIGATQPQTSANASTANRNESGPITIDSDEEEPDSTVRPSRVEDDEVMARRLQDEMYGNGGTNQDPEGVRAPIGRRTETLLGPGADWREDPEEMNAAIGEQLMARQQRRGE